MKTTAEPRFARIAAMIGDPTRSRMLAVLLDGGLLTAGEIARAADVTPQTASVHLAKLLENELIASRAQGRHRYFKLADGDVAHAIEALAMVADKNTDARPGRRFWSRDAMQPLRHARTCYGHLAGRLGVQLHDALIAHDAVTLHDDRYRLADGYGRVFDGLGFDAARVASSSRGIAYPCVDWSERRDHFAGPLAVALLTHFVDRGWLTRIAGSRALRPGPTSNPMFREMLTLRA